VDGDLLTMVDARGAILLFMLVTQTAYLASAQCTSNSGSGECSEESTSYSSASTEHSSASSTAKASSGPDGQTSTYSYASVTGSSENAHSTSSSSSSSSSGSSSSSAYAHASSSQSSTESHTVTEEVTVEVPHEPEPEEHPSDELPVVYRSCDHKEPVHPGKRVYFVTTEGEPCPEDPVPVTIPVHPNQPEQPTPPAPPVPPEDEHQVTARRVRALINSRNFTALSDFVIDSDDIYGMNMGLTFEDHEHEEETRITENREEDKDVVAVKGLASAALDEETKLKVIQLMVVTATAPDGYQFYQHRELAESFVEIFADDELLEAVVAANPETYSRRRLQCVGCTPVNSYVCAHCWPKSICKAYFWCSAGAQEDENEVETTEETTGDSAASLSEDSESSEDKAVAESAESTEGDEDEDSEEPDVNEQQKKKRRRRKRRKQRKKARKNN